MKLLLTYFSEVQANSTEISNPTTFVTLSFTSVTLSHQLRDDAPTVHHKVNLQLHFEIMIVHFGKIIITIDHNRLELAINYTENISFCTQKINANSLSVHTGAFVLKNDYFGL